MLKDSKRKHNTDNILAVACTHISLVDTPEPPIAAAATVSSRTHNAPYKLEKAIPMLRKSTVQGGHAPAIAFPACPRMAGTTTSVGK